MKNILFCYDKYCDFNSEGGTEISTYRIAKALDFLKKYNLYNAFYKGSIPDVISDLYEGVIKIAGNKKKFINTLSRYIIDNKIDILINMGNFYKHKSLYKAIIKSNRDVRLIFMHHFSPGDEITKIKFIPNLRRLLVDPFNLKYYWKSFFILSRNSLNDILYRLNTRMFMKYQTNWCCYLINTYQHI